MDSSLREDSGNKKTGRLDQTCARKSLLMLRERQRCCDSAKALDEELRRRAKGAVAQHRKPNWSLKTLVAADGYERACKSFLS